MPHGHDHGHDHPQRALLPRLLDLDAEVHAHLLTEAVAAVADLADGAVPVRRVLDVGAGTGTGSVALAERFSTAEVVAVDVDEQMLQRVRERAASAGLADRVSTLLADVGSDTPDLGRADVAWSSMALHEAADPVRAFGNLLDALRPGGLLVVVEMDAPSMVLPRGLAGFEQRLRDAAGATPAHRPDWTAALASTGFDDVATRTLSIDHDLPADGPAGEYAALELRRIGHVAAPRLDEPDRSAFEHLVGDGPGSVRGLGDLWVRGTRTLWSARRPA
ncbi:class I SAM-dependent methyltransferase [Aeromicrobium fastidiosum]|uniref:class I SAM-dependent methyltransferase n=1 Tax=Aeromicrobium fastidiosum TaxID=52699 RepID=UPI002023441D|nr:class I SAM-dependent methyltransferase [Aeromicrobium fastidiosum]MCL8252473.1 class I SAM-dependent methyltransferase [Aeromicrobium fastidiosum]